MHQDMTYALIHSPLVGPLTWQLVYKEMERRGVSAIVPTLRDRPDPARPFWQQHAEAVGVNLARLPRDRSIVLVAHSGAGPLLPVIRQTMAHSIGAYVFVDAGLPRHNMSRLDLMRLEDKQWAEQFYQTLLQGGKYPTWSEDDLQEVIPDQALRRGLVSEVRPRALAFFSEPIPVFPDWPEAPCAYIQFSAPYDWDFNQAKQAGWCVRAVRAGHFHMLVDPPAVTDVIIATVQEINSTEQK